MGHFLEIAVQLLDCFPSGAKSYPKNSEMDRLSRAGGVFIGVFLLLITLGALTAACLA
jgi:hypothetical protein